MATRRQFLQYGFSTAFGAGLLANRVEASQSQRGENEFTVTNPITINSFDGTTLVTTLFVPTRDGPFPAVLMTHGWGGTRADRRPLAEFYASHGYVVLTFDSRGFGASGGEVGGLDTKAINDVQTLISWLALRGSVKVDEDGDPRIGMDGISYGAGTQLMTAIVDDRLDALVPRWGWHDLRFSLDPNSDLKWPWLYGLYASAKQNGNPTEELLEQWGKAIETKQASEELRESWAATSPVGKLGCIDTPTLLISGWEDRLFMPNEAFANYQGLCDTGTETRLLMYDLGHDFITSPSTRQGSEAYQYQAEFADDAALSWMDHHLKGEELTDLAQVTFYRSQTNEFETYDELPSHADAVPLSTTTETSASQLKASQKNNGADTVSFDFTLAEPTDLVGIPRLWLSVTPTGKPPRYLFGALKDVSPSGEATIINDQVATASVEQEGLLSFDLIGVEHHLPADHTLRLTLTFNDDTLISDKIPFGDGLYVDSKSPAGTVVKHSPSDPSTLAVPTLDPPVRSSGLGQNDEDDDGDGAVDEDDEGGGPSNDDDDGDGAIDEDDEPDDGDDGADDFNGRAEDDDDGDGAIDEDDEPDSGNSDDVDNDGDGAVDEDDESDTGD
jgi:ABC-2 type transport system ATP-binding protein